VGIWTGNLLESIPWLYVHLDVICTMMGQVTW